MLAVIWNLLTARLLTGTLKLRRVLILMPGLAKI